MRGMKIDKQKIIANFPLTVSNIIEKIESRESIYRIIIYGSRVHNDFKAKSDFDIAVDFWEPSHFEFLRLKDEVENDYKSLYFISIVDYNSSPNKLKDIINKKGIIIYESKKNTK